MAAYLGIDFSGSAAQWRPIVRRPSVWIARLEGCDAAALRLADLSPAQDLPGPGNPFNRLIHLLRAGDYAAAAIDAPFSLPLEHQPDGGRAGLLHAILTIPHEGRPFPRGPDLIALAEEVRPKRSKKPLRRCEAYWTKRGVNTRSTLWWKPRGGAPFAAACLAVLARAGRPCWPWDPVQDGILAEAFPAAQLRHWGLKPTGYSGTTTADVAARARLVEAVARRAELPERFRGTMLHSADALDSVIAAFGAFAVRTGRIGVQPETVDEGWIAVMA